MAEGCSTGSLNTDNTMDVDVPPPPSSKKYSIFVDLDGAKGSDVKKWSTRCGVLLRSIVPVGYAEWNDVDVVYKNNLWKALMREFELNIDPKVARPILEKSFPQYYRSMKSKVRKTYLKQDGQLIPKEIAYENRPDDIDKVWWKRFLDIEYTDKKRKQCKTNANNKSKSTMTHTLGRKSYRRLYEELEAENSEEKVTRTKVWKVGHTSKKTGMVIPCAAEKYALVEAAEERQKARVSLNDDDGSGSFEDFDNDPIAEVFGDEKRKSYCRAVSSRATLKQVKVIQASKAIAKFKEQEDRKWKMNMEEKTNQLADNLKSVNSTMQSMQQSLMQFMSQYGGNQTPRADATSNTEHNHNSHHNSVGANLRVHSDDAIGSSSRDRQSVVLLSDNLTEVAKGHLGTQKICHHREVLQGEKVVWVEQVYDPEAPIYKAPQNGNYKLSDIIDGGFIIWSECRLRTL